MTLHPPGSRLEDESSLSGESAAGSSQEVPDMIQLGVEPARDAEAGNSLVKGEVVGRQSGQEVPRESGHLSK